VTGGVRRHLATEACISFSGPHLPFADAGMRLLSLPRSVRQAFAILRKGLNFAPFVLDIAVLSG